MMKLPSVLLCLLLCACSEAQADIVSTDGVMSTSIMRLLVRPEDYHGRRVSVIGIYARGFENSSLYLDSEALQTGNTELSLWVDVSSNKLADAGIGESFVGHVAVTATFFYRPGEGVGHMGGYPAELQNVEMISKQTVRIPGLRDRWLFLLVGGLFSVVFVTGYLFGRRERARSDRA